MDWFFDYKVAWMMVLFVGVLYWAFRSRYTNRPRRPPQRPKKDDS